LRIFYSETHFAHNPSSEIFDGWVRFNSLEGPERATRILEALHQNDWAEIIPPIDFVLNPILEVHDKDYVDLFAIAWSEWLQANPEVSMNADDSALLLATFPPADWRHRPEGLLRRAD
jgi:acetoin utilization deacetylase AcuC-like enzyme